MTRRIGPREAQRMIEDATPGPWRVQVAACDHEDAAEHAAIKGGGFLVVTCVGEHDAEIIAAAGACRAWRGVVTGPSEGAQRQALSLLYAPTEESRLFLVAEALDAARAEGFNEAKEAAARHLRATAVAAQGKDGGLLAAAASRIEGITPKEPA